MAASRSAGASDRATPSTPWTSSPTPVLDGHPPRRLIGNALAGIAFLSDSILSPSKWRLVLRGGVSCRGDPYMLEGRTTLLPFKRASRSTAPHGHKFLTIGDNMSSPLSFEKGRARDWGFRQLTRVSAAQSIVYELDQRHCYAETDRNPSDRDSRAVERGEVRTGQVQSGPRRELQLLMNMALAAMAIARRYLRRVICVGRLAAWPRGHRRAGRATPGRHCGQPRYYDDPFFYKLPSAASTHSADALCVPGASGRSPPIFDDLTYVREAEHSPGLARCSSSTPGARASAAPACNSAWRPLAPSSSARGPGTTCTAARSSNS